MNNCPLCDDGEGLRSAEKGTPGSYDCFNCHKTYAYPTAEERAREREANNNVVLRSGPQGEEVCRILGLDPARVVSTASIVVPVDGNAYAEVRIRLTPEQLRQIVEVAIADE